MNWHVCIPKGSDRKEYVHLLHACCYSNHTIPAANGHSVQVFRSVYSSVRFSFKMRAFSACFRSSIRWRESSVWCFDDLKRFNGITRGGDFIVNEMAWQYYLCTNNKTKRKVISHAFLLAWTQSKALDAVTIPMTGELSPDWLVKIRKPPGVHWPWGGEICINSTVGLRERRNFGPRFLRIGNW